MKKLLYSECIFLMSLSLCLSLSLSVSVSQSQSLSLNLSVSISQSQSLGLNLSVSISRSQSLGLNLSASISHTHKHTRTHTRTHTHTYTALGITRVGLCADGNLSPGQNVTTSSESRSDENSQDCEICRVDSYCAGSTQTQCGLKQQTIGPGQARVDDCKCEAGYWRTTHHVCVGIVDPMVYTPACLTNQDQTC